MLEDPVETRLYLSAPPLAHFDEAVLTALLAHNVACVGVNISEFSDKDSTALERMIAVADAAGCAIVIGGDDANVLELAGRFAVDGVQIEGSAARVADARKRLGKDAIIGYAAGQSRPDALSAAEADADYVLLSPISEIEHDLAVWWQAVVETPLVIGGITAIEHVDRIKGIADFAMLEPDYANDAAPDFIAEVIARLS